MERMSFKFAVEQLRKVEGMIVKMEEWKSVGEMNEKERGEYFSYIGYRKFIEEEIIKIIKDESFIV